MKKIMLRLWQDDVGALIATEYLFIATILVIGIIVGLVGLRNAIVTEFTELGNAILAINNGFTWSGSSGAGGNVPGSMAIDTPSLLVDPVSTPPAIPSVIDALPNN